MSSSTQPLDRLKYYNGQRLNAEDFQLEQDYHIRVLCWLNKSLYDPGIADGLLVSQTRTLPGAPPVQSNQIVVSPGLAIDGEGRSIILIEETVLNVVGVPNNDPSWVFGNFLTIRYAEATAEEVEDGCKIASASCDYPWGGPSRVRAAPVGELQTCPPSRPSH